MRLLVFGAGGQLGQELTALGARRGIALVGLRREEADIADSRAVAAALDREIPGVVVNAGAYTKVDKAEAEREEAYRANAVGPEVLAEACRARGLPLIHLSTDYVFDGTKDGAYRESDPAAPLGVYGASKAAGEGAVRERLREHVILRTAWVYGAYGANFLKTVLRLARERDELRIVADQHGNPTATADLAAAVVAAAERSLGPDPVWGTFHFTGQGATTWHGFASEIVAAQAPFTGRRPAVRAITTSEYPTPAARPANSRLDDTRFSAEFGLRAEPWQDRTREVVRELVGGG